jgi:hypothetical protein
MHIFKDGSVDLALGFNQLERLMMRQLLRSIDRRDRAFGKCAGSGKSGVGGDQVQVVMKHKGYPSQWINGIFTQDRGGAKSSKP